MVALTEQMALEEGEPLVATVGRLEVKRELQCGAGRS